MKTITHTNSKWKWLIAFLFLSTVSYRADAAWDWVFNLNMTNCTSGVNGSNQPTMTFDLYVQPIDASSNLDVDTMKSLNYRFNMNRAAITPAGTVNGTMVYTPGSISPLLSAAGAGWDVAGQITGSVTINSTTVLMQIAYGATTFTAGTAPKLTHGTSYKLGTFTITLTTAGSA